MPAAIKYPVADLAGTLVWAARGSRVGTEHPSVYIVWAARGSGHPPKWRAPSSPLRASFRCNVFKR